MSISPATTKLTPLQKYVLRELYRGYLKNKKNRDNQPCRITLGAVDEPETNTIFEAIRELKKGKIIKDYKEHRKYLEEGDEIIYLDCNISNENFIEYLKSASLIFEPEYYITLEKGNTVVLNGQYVMRKPQYDSPNEIFFRCVYENPNRRLYKEDFTNFLIKFSRDKKAEFRKSFKYCVRELQFTGELGRMFFSSSNRGVEFRNPVLKSDIEKLKIDRQKLEKQIKGLKLLNSRVRNGEKK